MKENKNISPASANPPKTLTEIGSLVSSSADVGYLKMDKDGKLKIVGFDGLYGHRGIIECINGVLLFTPDDDFTSHGSIRFEDEVIASKIMTDYFTETDAINCLFVKVWNVFTQCKGVYIYDS